MSGVPVAVAVSGEPSPARGPCALVHDSQGQAAGPGDARGAVGCRAPWRPEHAAARRGGRGRGARPGRRGAAPHDSGARSNIHDRVARAGAGP